MFKRHSEPAITAELPMPAVLTPEQAMKLSAFKDPETFLGVVAIVGEEKAQDLLDQYRFNTYQSGRFETEVTGK